MRPAAVIKRGNEIVIICDEIILWGNLTLKAREIKIVREGDGWLVGAVAELRGLVFTYYFFSFGDGDLMEIRGDYLHVLRGDGSFAWIRKDIAAKVLAGEVFG